MIEKRDDPILTDIYWKAQQPLHTPFVYGHYITQLEQQASRMMNHLSAAYPDISKFNVWNTGDEKPAYESYLSEAQRVVKERENTYMPPSVNFLRVAIAWSWFLMSLTPNEQGHICLTPAHVASMMILFKQAREMGDTKRDNWVDMAGYIDCADEIKQTLAACGFELADDGTDTIDDLIKALKHTTTHYAK